MICEKFFGYGGDERFSVSDCLSSELLLSFLHNYIDNEFCCSEDWEKKRKEKKRKEWWLLSNFSLHSSLIHIGPLIIKRPKQ